MLYYLDELLADIPFDAARFAAENFWSEVAAVYRHQFTHYCERPWVFGIAKSGGPVSMEGLANGPIATLWESAQGLLQQLVQRGRELGVIREDLPDELLETLLIAVDVAHDRWLYAHWTDMGPADIDAAAWQLLNFYYKGEEWSRKAWTARGLSKELWDQVNTLLQKRGIRRGRKAQLEPKTMAHAWGLWCEAKLKNRTLYRHGDGFLEGG